MTRESGVPLPPCVLDTPTHFLCYLRPANASFSTAGLDLSVFFTPRKTLTGPLAMPLALRALYFQEVTFYPTHLSPSCLGLFGLG